jgi:Sugar kinases, ribokinase family
MSKILVAGMINSESTVKVPVIPVEYMPISYSFFNIDMGISGSGYNVGKALNVLGDEVTLLSAVGKDDTANVIIKTLDEDNIKSDYVLSELKETPKSVVFYEESGKRQIFCDLKDLQDYKYDPKLFSKALKKSDIVVLANSNFCRPLLSLAKDAGKTVSSTVHAVSDAYDEYNADFMKYSDILFVSDDNLTDDPYQLLKTIASVYDNQIIILGRGAKGAMLYVKADNFIGKYPAVRTREIVNTVGAGDALYSAFLHFYSKTLNPYYSLKCALLFCSYKIGTAGSANGFLSEDQLVQYYSIIWK